jgi:SSS family solute:Na+ symporter
MLGPGSFEGRMMLAVDWLLVILPVLLVVGFALYTRRFVVGVADFLAGGRCAGRYLICNARGEAASGVANTMARFEVIMVSGFTLAFWEQLSVPILLLVGIMGFVIYRYRETRAMTLAQFFEMRYSRRFRLFMGGLAFVSGILNYGIFPAISSRFFVYFMGLPPSVSILGTAIPTYAIIMAAYLACSLTMLTLGGQITLMVTDCIEGLLSHLIYLILIVAVFYTISWSQITHVMSSQPTNRSMINPFDAWEVSDFNFWYMVMNIILTVYGTMALQNSHGFNSAARTPHEARMAGVLGNWRTYARMVMLLVLATAAVTFLKHPDFATSSAPVQGVLSSIDNPQIQKQMTVPVALRFLLPAGIKGLFCCIMVLGLIAGDCGHMHSWGTIFVQDVVMPLRKKDLSPRQHIWLMRLSIIGVALFAFCFSIIFRQTHYIALWMQITAGVFISGAGAAIIGGLYWRRGTTAGAWAAVLTGATLSFIGILANQFWPKILLMTSLPLPAKFPLNGIKVAFIAAIAASTVYIVTSLLNRRPAFDLDHLLNRSGGSASPSSNVRRGARSWVAKILGFNDQFTRRDKWVAFGIFAWSLTLVLVNLIISSWNVFFQKWPIRWWETYWFITAIAVPTVIATATFFWFGIGGIRDLTAFFRALKILKRDIRDNGQVSGKST